MPPRTEHGDEIRSKGIGGRGVLVVLAAALLLIPACHRLSSPGTRKDALEFDLLDFHMALLSQDIPRLVRHLPPKERARWAEAFGCYFEAHRVIDYRVAHITTAEKATEATVIVSVTGRPQNSMVVREHLWKQKWRNADNHWQLVPEGFQVDEEWEHCLPPPEKDAAPEASDALPGRVGEKFLLETGDH